MNTVHWSIDDSHVQGVTSVFRSHMNSVATCISVEEWIQVLILGPFAVHKNAAGYAMLGFDGHFHASYYANTQIIYI